MIAYIEKLFSETIYPKRLKEVIDEVLTKGELDRDAVKRMNKYIFSRFIWPQLVVGLPVLSLVILTEENMAVVALASSVPLGLHIGFLSQMKRILSRYPTLYTRGAFTVGLIDSYFEPSRPSDSWAWGMGYTFHVNGVMFKSSTGSLTDSLRSERFYPGESIAICYDQSNPELSAPITSRMFGLFCLNRSFTQWEQLIITQSPN